MGFLTKLDNALNAAKSELFGENVQYARLASGDDTYTYGRDIYGPLSFMGIGKRYDRPIQNLKYYYRNVFFLQDCINLYADFASQVKIQEVDKNGKVIEDSPFLDFLKEPNVLQNQKEFIKEMVINLLTFGISLQYGNFFEHGNMSLAPRLYNLDYNTLAFPAIKNRYALKKTDLKNISVKEKIEGQETRTIPFSQLAFFYDTLPNNGYGKSNYDCDGYLRPMSRIFALITSINTLLNTQKSMAYMSGHNVNKAVSKKTHAAGAHAPLKSDQKYDIEAKLNGRERYGLGKDGDTVFSNEELTVSDLTRNVSKMQLREMQETAKENTRNNFLIPKDFFGDSTYENKQMSEARFILGQVKTITDNWLNEITNKTPKYFEARGTHLVGNYNHLTSVADTQNKLRDESMKSKAQAIISILDGFQKYKELVNIDISWDEFKIENNLSEYFKQS